MGGVTIGGGGFSGDDQEQLNRRTQKMKDAEDDYAPGDREEGGGAPTMPPSFSKKETTGGVKSAANRIVSKKELADSGLSLRDFLNKERGLTRRPDAVSSPMKDPTAGEAREGPAAQLAADKMGDVNPRDAEKNMSRGRRAPTGEIANLDSRAVRDRKTAQMMMEQDEKLRVNKAANRLGQTLTPSYPKDTGEETVLNKRGGKIKAYAKGGSVSASSRGDGCAQRGKTRGMMR
jgi:hypothetical protein